LHENNIKIFANANEKYSVFKRVEMVETEREIMDTIRSHILRHDSLLRITLEGQIEGKKAYGRP